MGECPVPRSHRYKDLGVSDYGMQVLRICVAHTASIERMAGKNFGLQPRAQPKRDVRCAPGDKLLRGIKK